MDARAAAQATEALLRQLSTGHVIITSRLADWSGQVTLLDLDVLSEDAAAGFLLERTAARRAPSPEDPAAARQLARLLDGLALALEQAAAYIREQRLTLAAYIGRWQAVPAEAIAWHDAVKMQYPRSLAITYETSVVQLGPGAQELFRILAWVAPDPVPLAALEALTLPGERRALLMELDHLHLVRFRADGQSFAVHRLVQEITRKKQSTPLPPPSLLTALNWINGLFIVDPVDVRTWPVLDPLASHAQSLVSFADAHAIPDPTPFLMNRVALFIQSKAQRRGAEPLMRRAVAILEGRFGMNHPEVAMGLNNLAILLCETNHLAAAEPLLRRALMIHEVSYGIAHPHVASASNSLAMLLKATNRVAEAEPLMRRALTIDEASFGKNHPSVAIRLNNLAQLLQDTNRFAESERLMRRGLGIDEAHYGQAHPRVAIDLNNLALLFATTGRHTEAQALMRRALAIDAAAYGEDHPNVAMGRSNLAQLLTDTNRHADAEPLLRRALTDCEASLGKNHPNIATCLNNLALVFVATDRKTEAEPLIRRALAIFEASYGEGHPEVANSIDNLAQLLQDTNRQTEAEPLMRRALAIDEATYGKDHPKVALRLNNLAGLLYATNCVVEAEPLARRNLEILVSFTRATGHLHPHLNGSIKNYGQLLMDMSDSEAQAQEKIDKLLRPLRSR